MRIKIPQQEIDALKALAVLGCESSYLISASRHGHDLLYLDSPIVMKGYFNNSPAVMQNERFQETLQDSRTRGYVLIEGHTHPEPEGQIIFPYSCGWTLPRTSELRDYRNSRLEKTEPGRRALGERLKIIDQIAAEEDEAVRKTLFEKLIIHSPETAVANFMEISGVNCYITNRVDLRNQYNLINDINPDDGDFQVETRKSLFEIDTFALVHAMPQYVHTESSRDKFMLSIFRFAGSDYDSIEKIEVESI